MLPTFKKGQPLSAAKFNQLSDAIRVLGGGVTAAAELPVPKHFDPPTNPEMDFAVEYRKDDRGAWGWCYHKGHVVVKGASREVGDQDWTKVADDSYDGEIKLVVDLDDEGNYKSAVVQKGNAGGGSATKKEFPLAKIGKSTVWMHAGGPVYVTGECCVVGGNGITVKAKKEEDKMVYKVEQEYSLSFVNGPGISIDDTPPGGENPDTRVIRVAQTYLVSFVAGPGIEISESKEGNEPGEAVHFVNVSATAKSVCVVEGSGIVVKSSDDDAGTVFTVHSKYYITLVNGTGIDITPEYITDANTGVMTQKFTIGTRIAILPGNDEISVKRDGLKDILTFMVYGLHVCVVGGPGIFVEEAEDDMERIFTVNLSPSFVFGPGLLVEDGGDGVKRLYVDISWVANELML